MTQKCIFSSLELGEPREITMTSVTDHPELTMDHVVRVYRALRASSIYPDYYMREVILAFSLVLDLASDEELDMAENHLLNERIYLSTGKDFLAVEALVGLLMNRGRPDVLVRHMMYAEPLLGREEGPPFGMTPKEGRLPETLYLEDVIRVYEALRSARLEPHTYVRDLLVAFKRALHMASPMEVKAASVSVSSVLESTPVCWCNASALESTPVCWCNAMAALACILLPAAPDVGGMERSLAR